MIIGNNNNNNNFSSNKTNFTSNFNERFTTIMNEGQKNSNKISPINETTQTKRYSKVNRKKEMSDKSFAMLQERLNSGTITLEEFNKKCNQLNKMRQK